MANICNKYEVHGCPASYYMNCQAYASDRNCWEVRRKPCCPITDESECVDCEIYHRGKAELDKSQE